MTSPNINYTGLLDTIAGWEYWQSQGQIYRVAADNRGYLVDGLPANARWECDRIHYARYIATD